MQELFYQKWLMFVVGSVGSICAVFSFPNTQPSLGHPDLPTSPTAPWDAPSLLDVESQPLRSDVEMGISQIRGTPFMPQKEQNPLKGNTQNRAPLFFGSPQMKTAASPGCTVLQLRPDRQRLPSADVPGGSARCASAPGRESSLRGVSDV